MERRHFLTLALGLAAGTAALAAAAAAAPLMPQGLQADDASRAGQGIGQEIEKEIGQNIRPAVTSRDEVDQLRPEQVRWGHHWHRRHWGWHHRRHWGWRHRHWHRHWHHRHW